MIDDSVWLELKKHYEAAYKIKFTKRPSDKNIQFLLEKKRQLENEVAYLRTLPQGFRMMNEEPS